jgi:hypothetical protein
LPRLRGCLPASGTVGSWGRPWSKSRPSIRPMRGCEKEVTQTGERGSGTSSPQSRASRSLPLALFHISSSCYGNKGVKPCSLVKAG